MPQQEETIFNLNVTPDTIDEEVKKALDLHRLLRQPDFEYWFEEWEKGFPEATLERGVGNFQLGGETPWRGQPDQRPRYREWTSKEQRQKWGYRQIEYWENRSIEGQSHFFQGTDAELIRHILQLEYEGGGAAASKGKGGNLPRLKGQPMIKLYFFENPSPQQQLSPGKTLGQGEISVRIMDKTDDPSNTKLEKISKSDVRQYATKVAAIFGANKGYVWEKGKATVSYRSRYQGIEGWYYVRSKSAGRELVGKLLSLFDQELDPTKLFYSENFDPSTAYPEAPPTETLLGEQIQTPSKRPIVDVRFGYADLDLPRLSLPIRLCEGDRVVYNPE